VTQNPVDHAAVRGRHRDTGVGQEVHPRAGQQGRDPDSGAAVVLLAAQQLAGPPVLQLLQLPEERGAELTRAVHGRAGARGELS